VSTAPLLTCAELDVAYGAVQILFGVDLHVEHHEIVALLGTNGAGKSTLLRAISQLVTPSDGSIIFDGRDITRVGPGPVARAGIVHVSGGRATFPRLTVAEHFEAGTWLLRDVDQLELDRRREEVLDLFPALRRHWRTLGGVLSGGEQQQLALALAFIARPRLLVIDELSLGLAPIVVEQLLDSVRHVQAMGSAVLIVEQSVNVALTIAERAYFMEKGTVRFEGPTADLLERPDLVRSVFLSRATREAARPASGVAAADTPTTAPVLQTEGLSRRFGGVVAVDGVGFELRRAEILGLIGPNGAGKTTIFDLISGQLPAHEGSVVLHDQDVTAWAPDRRARAGMCRSFQDARVFRSLTVAENLAVSLDRHLPHRDHFAALLALPVMREMEQDVAYAVEDLIELFGLGAYRDRLASELSTGSRRILDIAMAMAHDPSVLLLDEPSSGVAQQETESLGEVIRRLREQTGCAVLLIEHDMALVASLADRILALELGRSIACDTPATVLSDPRVVASYLGTDDATINRGGKRKRTRPARRPAVTASGRSGADT
jgi:branched-chain amino acid transport system ATP-binding protein